MFFSFDGIDGVGKSTQAELFCEWLREQGHTVVACRDPGSTALGERVRDILLDGAGTIDIHARAEMLLYMAARAQLVEEVIRPALANGGTVVSDRYLLANVVYQGYAGGLPVDELRTVGAITIAGLEPDCVFVLDLPPAAAAQRLDRELDRMEQRGDAYRQMLRQGYLAEATMQPERFHVIDASLSIDAIQQSIRTIAQQRLDRAAR